MNPKQIQSGSIKDVNEGGCKDFNLIINEAIFKCLPESRNFLINTDDEPTEIP